MIGHNLGIVDENYAKNAEDEAPGKSVALLASDIKTFAAICERVINHLVQNCPEINPPRSA